jgi:hypothetical protein
MTFRRRPPAGTPRTFVADRGLAMIPTQELVR